MGRHHSQVKLLCRQDLLPDELSLCNVLAKVGSDGPVLITAVVSELTVEELKKHVQLNDYFEFAPKIPIGFTTMDWIDPDKHGRSYRRRAPSPFGALTFPEPQDININMLPFVMGEKASLPDEYQHYWPLIEYCSIPVEEHGKVGYLTIQESLVPAGQSQRRPGLHIETPGLVMTNDGKYHEHQNMWGCGLLLVQREYDPNPDLPRVEGGIYMASNTAKSCRIWNALITDPG